MRIPFTIPDVSDIDEAEGFIYLEEGFLVIEYQIKKLGLFRRPVETVKVERGVVKALELRRKLFGDRLVIETTSMQLLREVPGKHVAGVELRTQRKYRDVIEDFIEEVHAWVDGFGPGLPR